MRTHVTQEDEGKAVTYEDDTVGRVVEVDDGTAYVDPDPSITETVKSTLGWAEADEESFALDENSIATVDEDEIELEVAT